MFGVSPAFFLSLHGEDFSVDQLIESLPLISGIGFDAFQGEVFKKEKLKEWVNGGALRLAEAAEDQGLELSQLVGHFLLHAFSDKSMLESDFGIEELQAFASTLSFFPGCDLVTIVLPSFDIDAAPNPVKAEEIFSRLENKLRQMLSIAEEGQFRLGIELMPSSLITGTGELARLFKELDSDRLGYNFDTGHAWNYKEKLELIPFRLAGKIFGTHLCDNDGKTNTSDLPGSGSINWENCISAIICSGYSGSWDLEIRCPPEEVEENYKRGLDFIKSRIEATKEKQI